MSTLSVCVQLLKYNLTIILVLVSNQSYSPSARCLCPPPHSKILDLPLVYKSTMSKGLKIKMSTSQNGFKSNGPQSKGLQVKRSPVKRVTSQTVPSQKGYKSNGPQSKGLQVKRSSSQKG